MISLQTALKILRALPGVTEKDHFGSDAFAANGRNFATVWSDDDTVNLRLSPADQREFLENGGEAFREIDNGYAKMGWTTVVLEFIDIRLFRTAARAAHEHSAVKTSFGRKKRKARRL